MIIAVLIFIAYNYFIFLNISKILIEFKRNTFVYIIVSLFNCFLMIISYNMMIPYYMSYFNVLIVLVLEFLMFSKAKVSQAFLCSGMIVVNISSIQIIVITIFTYINKITPHQLFNTPKLFYQSLSILIIILFIIFLIKLKFIPIKDIIKLSTTPNYCIMISLIVLFVLFYTIFDIIALQSKYYFHQMTPRFIATPILTLCLYYVLFTYSIKSVKIVQFKRKSDELETIKLQNNIHKKNIQNKINKDKLTSCYNRKFIMNLLNEFKENNTTNFAILFIDVDGLKFVNDNLGHDAGDKYILTVSRAIRDVIREHDLVARIGGDEFLVILTYLEEENISKIIERLKSKIKFLDSIIIEHKISVSVGYVFVDENLIKNNSIEDLVKIADDRMRIEKKLSKERKDI